VKAGCIRKIEELFLFSVPIKEAQIIDHFLPDLKDEMMRLMSVQKQTSAGQRTRFKAFVAVGDSNGHVGVGSKCAKEVALAIRAAVDIAKLSIVPVRRGYWGSKIGRPHTVPVKLTGSCGSVRVRLVPAPRGAGVVAARVSKKILQMAGIEDVYTSTQGSTKTGGNFAMATFDALRRTYGYITPDLWRETAVLRAPYHQFSKELQESEKKSF
jgi:small subunit ribosomal protein S2e